MPKLPEGDRAIVDLRKLLGYCLRPYHPRGRHKARVFREVLGIGPDQAPELQRLLLAAAGSGDATPLGRDAYGERFMLDVPITGGAGTGTVRTHWIVRSGERVPRLVTCFVL